MEIDLKAASNKTGEFDRDQKEGLYRAIYSRRDIQAEGLGVGWVSIMQPRDLKEILSIPGKIVPIAYLCIGYVSHFSEKPELESAAAYGHSDIVVLLLENEVNIHASDNSGGTALWMTRPTDFFLLAGIRLCEKPHSSEVELD